MSVNTGTGTLSSSHRKISLTAGWLYLLTFVSIPTLALYTNVKGANYILGSGSDSSALIGGLLEIIVALAGIGTAVVLFAILKEQNESAAIGLIASRVLEASAIFIGVATILTIVSLKQTGAGGDSLAISHTLATLYDRIFLISQSLLPAVNDLLLGFLLYQSRLVPRALSLIGIVGGPVLIAGFIAVFFGIIEYSSPLKGLFAIGVALFEFSLGVWLVVKGFNAKAVVELDSKN
jgi:hypothetical protein